MEHWKKDLLAVICILLTLGVFGWINGRKHQATINNATNSTKLQPNEVTAVIVNPEKHEIQIVTKAGTKTKYLPTDNPTRIDITKNGTIEPLKVSNWDFKIHPFAGFSIDSKLRGELGADFLSYKRVSIFGGVGFNNHLPDTVGNVGIAYNVWSNSSLGIQVNNHKQISGVLKIRF